MSKKEKKKQEPVTEETVAEEPVKVEQPEKSAEELRGTSAYRER